MVAKVIFLLALQVVVVVGKEASKDSDDCLTEFRNGEANNDLTPFCSRCENEKSANPLRDRCSHCYNKKICDYDWPKKNDHAMCELDSSEAVTAGIDSALAIWATTKRCVPGSDILKEAPVLCSTDVAEAISSVTAMAAAIAKMVDDCDGIKKSNHACAFASNAVVSAAAGLAADGGHIAHECAHCTKGYGDILETRTTLGKCTADAADSMNSVFHATNTLNHVKKNCGSGKKCTVDVLDMVSVLAHFGSYLSGAVGHCTHYQTTHRRLDDAHYKSDALCASAIFHAIGDLTEIAELGLHMEHACGGSSSRLYLDTDKRHVEDPTKRHDVAATTGNPLVLALAAVLPVTAVLSFIAGSRFAKSHRQTRSIAVWEESEPQD